MFEGLQQQEKTRIAKTLALFLLVLTAFFFFKVIYQIRSFRYLGGVPQYNSITVSGHGEVLAKADTATVTYSYTAEATTVKEAQDMLNEKINAVAAKLTEIGIEEDSIKTTSFVSTPKYKYDGYTKWPRYEQDIVGYKVEQTNELKIKDTELVEPVLAAIAESGDFQVYGPMFEVGDTDALEEEARSLAIQDAKDEAQRLAKDLGVKLVGVMSFYDESDYGPYYGGDYAARDVMYAMPESAPVSTPNLSEGEDTITKNVSVTFEIR
ncbi:SIMPL domain-containing protein [Candidatus Nomurabacteria bacterium]|nr:SIMPL domain-containing protein [Candidatus Nomurabacteria bacterium]MCB9820518.1 SIMPL domain-containing protein [Candidatus Nomurabacteria bacterium]